MLLPIERLTTQPPPEMFYEFNRRCDFVVFSAGAQEQRVCKNRVIVAIFRFREGERPHAYHEQPRIPPSQ